MSDSEVDTVLAQSGTRVLLSDSEPANLGAGEWLSLQRLVDLRLSTGGASASASSPRSAQLTGGTSGMPRVVLEEHPWCIPADRLKNSPRYFRPDDVQLVISPLHHMGFRSFYSGLLYGQRVVLMQRFAPGRALKLVEEEEVTLLKATPTHMEWMLEALRGQEVDLSSLRVMHHTAAMCPARTKRAWIEILGPDRVIESYSCREDIGLVTITGREWLEHPGSVGRPASGTVRIAPPDGLLAPPTEVGRIYFRTDGRLPQYADDAEGLAETPDGYATVGDLGYLIRRLSVYRGP